MSFSSSHIDLKHINRLAVINLVKKQPRLSRADIAKATGLNKSTIGKIVQELLDEFWLREELTPTLLDGAGRRPTGLILNPDVLTLLGAEFGVDYIAVVACSITGEIRFQSRIPYQHTSVAASVAQLADILCHTWNLMLSLNHQVLGLGVSVPGLVHADTERVVHFPNIGWFDIDLAELLRAQFVARAMAEIEITIINDANAGALCEFVYGRSQYHRHPLVYMVVGIGVGAGIVTEHGLYRGYHGWAGEIGHSLLQPQGGFQCACGQLGCVETLVSQRALSRAALGNEQQILSVEQMRHLLQQGDERVTKGLNEIGYYLGIVLRNLANILNPETIVIGGSMSQFEDALLRPALASFQARTLPHLTIPHIQICEFGQNASTLGAAAAALMKYTEPAHTPTHLSQYGLLRK